MDVDLVSKGRRLLVNYPEHPLAEAHLDAIVVPSVRKGANLNQAGQLAAETGAVLVVVCSGVPASLQAAASLRARARRRWIVVSLYDSPWRHDLLRMSSDRVSEALWGWLWGDLDVKRNLGLVLARMVGWDRLLFLDDDIRGLSSTQLSQAAGLLGRHDLVGFEVRSFPDNSVVRHAFRLIGGEQDVFISGAALVTASSAAESAFFPHIYNEDWLYMLPILEQGPLGMVGQVRQLKYNPFRPARARAEEFGDLIAEGLLELLLTNGSLGPPPPAWWERCKLQRSRFLAELMQALHDSPHASARAAHAAVGAGLDRLSQIPAEACSDWVSSWRRDLSVWPSRLGSVPTGLSPQAALKWLGLSAIAFSSDL